MRPSPASRGNMLGLDAQVAQPMTANQLAFLGQSAAPAKKPSGVRWTKDEDERLRQAVQKMGANNWKTISQTYFPGRRTDMQCLHRWQKVLRPGLVKGPWSKAEDQIIIDCIAQGVSKWSEIASRIPGRVGKQCRERWLNQLDPTIKKGGWTDEEDKIMIEAQGQ